MPIAIPKPPPSALESARESLIERIAGWLATPQEGPMAFALDPKVSRPLLEMLVPTPTDIYLRAVTGGIPVLGMTEREAGRVFRGMLRGIRALGRTPSLKDLKRIYWDVMRLPKTGFGRHEVFEPLKKVGAATERGVWGGYEPLEGKLLLYAFPSAEGSWRVPSPLTATYAHELAHYLTMPGPFRPSITQEAADILYRAARTPTSKQLARVPPEVLHWVSSPDEIVASRVVKELLPEYVTPYERVAASFLEPRTAEELRALRYIADLIRGGPSDFERLIKRRMWESLARGVP